MKVRIQHYIYLTLACFILLSGLLLISCEPANETKNPNVEILEKLYNEGINKQNLDVIEASLADNYKRHCQAMPPNLQLIEDKETMMGLFKGHFAAFPDWHEEIEIKVVEENRIAYLSKGTGTQTGDAGSLPAKGNKCNLDHVIIHEFENGQIVESWVSWDNLVLLTQLGHYPPDSNMVDTVSDVE